MKKVIDKIPIKNYHVIMKPISKQASKQFCAVVRTVDLQGLENAQSLKEEKDEKESCGIDDECCNGFLAGGLRRQRCDQWQR